MVAGGKGGSIVNIASSWAARGTQLLAYATAKAGSCR
jgi:NAD(P)-dependent dehydrogenase (short-subunit alcohol dehydrogenase family)